MGTCSNSSLRPPLTTQHRTMEVTSQCSRKRVNDNYPPEGIIESWTLFASMLNTRVSPRGLNEYDHKWQRHCPFSCQLAWPRADLQAALREEVLGDLQSVLWLKGTVGETVMGMGTEQGRHRILSM